MRAVIGAIAGIGIIGIVIWYLSKADTCHRYLTRAHTAQDTLYVAAAADCDFVLGWYR